MMAAAFDTATDPETTIAEYEYDVLGRRVRKAVYDAEQDQWEKTVYVQTNRQVIAEYTSAGSETTPALSRKFVYGGYVDEPLMMINSDGGTETEYYYHRNRNYNVIALTDANGNEVERYTYSAYGEVVVLVDGGTGNPYFFTGRRLDDETGLMYYRARYYDGELGRFVGRDPLGYVDGWSLYAGYFALNLQVDPYGHKICWSKGKNKKDIKCCKKIVRLLTELIPQFKCNKHTDNVNGSLCIDSKKAKEIPGGDIKTKLIKDLANQGQAVTLSCEGKWWMASKDCKINIGQDNVYCDLFTDDKNIVPSSGHKRRHPKNEKEKAALLAHEMIHCYYKGESKSKSTKNNHKQLILGEREKFYVAIDFGKVNMEEAHTVGLALITGINKRRKMVRVTRFTAKYTENKIRDLLDLPRRLTYSEQCKHGNPDRFSKKWKIIEKTVKR